MPAGPSSTSVFLKGLVRRLEDWSVASQQQARRNAMVANDACTRRRAERDDVADYLDAVTHEDDTPRT